jgi:hypothetical protein
VFMCTEACKIAINSDVKTPLGSCNHNPNIKFSKRYTPNPVSPSDLDPSVNIIECLSNCEGVEDTILLAI